MCFAMPENDPGTFAEPLSKEASDGSARVIALT